MVVTPEHTVLPVNTNAVGNALITISAPLSSPTVAGLFDTTLILYPVPVLVPEGIIAEIVPLFVLSANVPITVGVPLNTPEASDN